MRYEVTCINKLAETLRPTMQKPNLTTLNKRLVEKL
jgi:hypothetical protein